MLLKPLTIDIGDEAACDLVIDLLRRAMLAKNLIERVRDALSTADVRDGPAVDAPRAGAGIRFRRRSNPDAHGDVIHDESGDTAFLLWLRQATLAASVAAPS